MMSVQQRTDSLYSWAYLGAAVLAVVLLVGYLECFGILLTVFVDDFHESNATVGWVGSSLFFVEALTNLISVLLLRRFSVRQILMFATVLNIFAFVSTAFMPSLPYLYFTYSLCFGISSGCVDFFGIVTLYEFFKRFIAAAVAMRYVATPLGAMLWSYLLPILLDSFGWRKTFMGLSSISCSIILLAAMYRPQDSREYEDNQPVDHESETLIDKEQQVQNACSGAAEKHNQLVDHDSETINDKKQEVQNACNGVPEKHNQLVDHDSETLDDKEQQKQNACNGVPEKHNQPVDHDSETLEDKEQQIQNACNGLPEKHVDLGDKETFGFLFNKIFLLNCVGYLFTTFTITIPTVFIVNYAKTLGHPLSKAKWLLVIRGIAMLTTRALSVRAGDIARRRGYLPWITGTAVVLYGVANGLCSLTQSLTLMMIFMATVGVLEGFHFMFLPLRVLRKGDIESTRKFTFFICAGGIGYFIGPPCIGWLLDETGEFRYALYVGCITGVGAGFLISVDICLRSSRDTNSTEYNTLDCNLRTKQQNDITNDRGTEDTFFMAQNVKWESSV